MFGFVAVLSLAVAIGANATIFGLVDAVLFKPLPGERPAPLVARLLLMRNLGQRHPGLCGEPLDRLRE